MNFALTDRQAHFRNEVRDFMEEHVRPKAAEYLAQSSSQPRWKVLPVLEDLEDEGARAAGLWDLFMPASSGRKAPVGVRL
jgi:alkylation response protein AidB-like acyl-CoA dehydrogenase